MTNHRRSSQSNATTSTSSINIDILECASTPSSFSVLTVGDGDLSCSLAIQRAYGGGIATSIHRFVLALVATTLLPNAEELLQTYETARAVIEELQESPSSEIFYGVDATQLHTCPDLCQRKFDVILFHHPHLGYDTDDTITTSSSTHATRHACLLAHYFDSARHLLSDKGSIHVCLCSGAVHSWELDDIVEHLNLEYVWGSPRAASRPLLEFLQDDEGTETVWVTTKNNDDGASAACSKSTATTSNIRMKDNSAKQSTGRHRAGGRRGHWLGRYGYRHRPTFPATTDFHTNVSNSYHYFLRPKKEGPRKNLEATTKSDESLRCHVCRQIFETSDALEAHKLRPALPVG